jgi:hypothetical protein
MKIETKFTNLNAVNFCSENETAPGKWESLFFLNRELKRFLFH